MACTGPKGQWRLILASDRLSELQSILDVLIALGKVDPDAVLSHVLGPEEELQIGWETTLVLRTQADALRIADEEKTA